MTIAIDFEVIDLPDSPAAPTTRLEEEDAASVLVPIAITDSMILSMKAAGNEMLEDTAPVWNGAATYAAGDRVHVPATHRVYESVKDGNVNKDPTLDANRYSAAGVATWWIETGPTNRYAMFDTLISTQTAAPGPFTVVIEPGAFNALAMFGLDADALSVTVYDTAGGELIYSYEAPLEGSQPADYYEYFFDPFKPQSQFIVSNLTPYGASRITLTFTKGSGTAKVGMLALGDLRPLGVPLRGSSVEPVDYSYVATDEFGNTTVRRRVSATGLTLQAKMDIADANTVLATVKEMLGVPAVVVGSRAKMYENLTVFGLLSGRLQYDDYGEPVLNMTVKGLI